MKKTVSILLMSALLLAPLTKIYSQDTVTFDEKSVPQWAKDIRRFDIIAFGTYPFAVMFTRLGYNQLVDEQDYGRYTGNKYKDILLVAAGVSLTLATIDIIITIAKRSKEKRRLENILIGSYEIEILPYGEDDTQFLIDKDEMETKKNQIMNKLREE